MLARSPFVLLLLLLSSSSSVFATLRCFESDLLDAAIKEGVSKLPTPVTGARGSITSKPKGRVTTANAAPVVKAVVPKVQTPTESTLQDGASKAVSQFSSSHLLTQDQSDKLAAGTFDATLGSGEQLTMLCVCSSRQRNQGPAGREGSLRQDSHS